MSVVDTMREARVRKLVRLPGLPLSECWVGYGAPEIKASHCAVLEEVAARRMTIDGKFAEVAGHIFHAERNERRQEGARRAAVTRRENFIKSPLSDYERRAMFAMSVYGEVAPDGPRQLEAMRSLLRRGLAMELTFKGGFKAFALTGAGRDYVRRFA